jgi:hypothetical protein
MAADFANHYLRSYSNHRLRVERQGDQLIVRGYSPSYYLKQLALLAVQESGQAFPIRLDIQVGSGLLRPSEGRAHS